MTALLWIFEVILIMVCDSFFLLSFLSFIFFYTFFLPFFLLFFFNISHSVICFFAFCLVLPEVAFLAPSQGLMVRVGLGALLGRHFRCWSCKSCLILNSILRIVFGFVPRFEWTGVYLSPCPSPLLMDGCANGQTVKRCVPEPPPLDRLPSALMKWHIPPDRPA